MIYSLKNCFKIIELIFMYIIYILVKLIYILYMGKKTNFKSTKNISNKDE